MKKFLKSVAFTAIAAVALTSASARTAPQPIKPFAVTFDAVTGTGFVGKGDVQTAFSWNNSQLQKNAAGVTFTYETEAKYEAVCTWTTGEGTNGEKIHDVTHKKKNGVNATIAYDARVRNQITGFNLTGFGTIQSSQGEVPVVGGACPGNQGHEGTWSSVELVSSNGGGLYVNHGGNSVLLPITPVM